MGNPKHLVAAKDSHFLAQAVGVVDVTITGRTKQIFSIWRKMQSKDRSFDQIMDTRAIRVIIEDGSPRGPIPGAPRLFSPRADRKTAATEKTPIVCSITTSSRWR